MGGVETDLDGRTSVRGLFAAGEVACTRVHGATAGEQLTARRAGVRGPGGTGDDGRSAGCRAAAGRDVVMRGFPDISRKSLPTLSERARNPQADVESVGLFRERSILQACTGAGGAAHALAEQLATDPALDHDGWRRASIVTVAALIARACAPPRREPRRALPHGFPEPGRLKMEGSPISGILFTVSRLP